MGRLLCIPTPCGLPCHSSRTLGSVIRLERDLFGGTRCNAAGLAGPCGWEDDPDLVLVDDFAFPIVFEALVATAGADLEDYDIL